MKSIIKYKILLAIILFSGLNSFSANNSKQSTFKIDSVTKQIKYQPMQFKLGFNLGLEFPYAIGAEGSFLFSELMDFNFGFGFGFSGAKIGLGTRIFPIRRKKISPLFGAYLFHTSGVSSINVYVNEDEAEFKITPDNALLINAGLRFRFSKGHYVIAAMGYSFPFKGEKAVYKSGSRASSVQTFADGLATGGFSVNIGILIKLSKGYYRKL